MDAATVIYLVVIDAVNSSQVWALQEELKNYDSNLHRTCIDQWTSAVCDRSLSRVRGRGWRDVVVLRGIIILLFDNVNLLVWKVDQIM